MSRRDSSTGSVLVIGGGPAGMATTAALCARGVAVDHVDRGGVSAIGGAYARMWPDIRLTSPARMIALPGLPLDPSAEYITAGEYRAYLERYGAVHGIAPRAADVRAVGTRGAAYEVRFAASDVGDANDVGREAEVSAPYRFVVVATGMFDHPVWPDIRGLREPSGPAYGAHPEVLHAADWRGPTRFRGRDVLIVGDASSAVEIAEACAQVGARVLCSAPRAKVRLMRRAIVGRDPASLAFPWLQRLPPALVRRMCERGFTAPGVDVTFSRLRAAGQIRLRPEVMRVVGRRAFFADGGQADIDVVILATGYRHAVVPLPEGLARTWAGLPRTRACESTSHIGLFFVGLPCARRLTSQYLYGIARDAVFVAERVAERRSG